MFLFLLDSNMERWWLTVLLSVLCSAQDHLSRDEVISRCMDVTRAELEPCLINLINEMQPMFGEGIPAFGIPKTNAIHLHSFNFTEKTSDNTFVDGTFYDVTVKGFDDVIVKELELDYDNHKAKTSLEFPDLFVSGRYILNASFAVVPLVGEGTFWMKLANILANGATEFDFVELEDGDYHFVPMHIDFDFDFEDANLRLNNLAQGNAVLKSAAEAIVKDNARDLIAFIKPQMIEQIGDIIKTMSDDFGRSLKLDEMAGNQYIRKAFNIP